MRKREGGYVEGQGEGEGRGSYWARHGCPRVGTGAATLRHQEEQEGGGGGRRARPTVPRTEPSASTPGRWGLYSICSLDARCGRVEMFYDFGVKVQNTTKI